MKKLFVLIFFIPIFCKAQDITGDVKAILNQKLDSFSVSLDSISLYPAFITGNATVTNADTIIIPINTSATIDLWLKAENVSTKETTRAYKQIDVRNFNGTYTLVSSSNIVSYPGGVSSLNTIYKANWAVVVTNNKCIIQVTGISGIVIKWSIVAHSIITTL